jgi:hypothetical protein
MASFVCSLSFPPKSCVFHSIYLGNNPFIKLMFVVGFSKTVLPSHTHKLHEITPLLSNASPRRAPDTLWALNTCLSKERTAFQEKEMTRAKT